MVEGCFGYVTSYSMNMSKFSKSRCEWHIKSHRIVCLIMDSKLKGEGFFLFILWVLDEVRTDISISDVLTLSIGPNYEYSNSTCARVVKLGTNRTQPQLPYRQGFIC